MIFVVKKKKKKGSVGSSYHKSWRTVKDKRKIPKLPTYKESIKKKKKGTYKIDGLDKYKRGKQKGKLYSRERTGYIKNIERDKTRVAKLPGKRISRTGHIYYEKRKNRSDLPDKDI